MTARTTRRSTASPMTLRWCRRWIFFPPMVDDPYTFGQIAAANALSDVYAMGGEVKTALNLVCFPESMDLNVLGEILRGGAEKVAEAGGILAGGHSIADTGVKYGLSVTGLVDPHCLTANDTGRPGDQLILTKALGVGLICTANRVGEAAPEQMEAAIRSMTTLNKTAAEIAQRYEVHAATDVTGFSFLGHLHEMMGGRLSCVVNARAVPVLPGAWEAADACLYTAAGQRNRNHTGPFVRFENVPFPDGRDPVRPADVRRAAAGGGPAEGGGAGAGTACGGPACRHRGRDPGRTAHGDHSEVLRGDRTMMLNVDARGDACPLPVVKAKKAIAALNGAGEVEVLVDNEIAVQNLTKMAQQKGYGSSAEKLAEREYRVRFTVGDASAAAEEPAVCTPDARTDTVVAIAADTMGEGARSWARPCSRRSSSR